MGRPCAAWQVNYVGKAANLYEDAGYQLSGSSYVVNKLLGTTWLWDRVRVVGGAYGGFSDFDSHSGARLTMSSPTRRRPRPLSRRQLALLRVQS